ncbi:MAG: leucine-rich repeat protein [Prevotella sp.]
MSHILPSAHQKLCKNHRTHVKVDAGREITIKAVANDGYGFSWMKINGLQQQGAEVTKTVTDDMTVSASFYYITPSVFMYNDVCYEKRWDANYWEEVTVSKLVSSGADNYYTGDLDLPEKVIYSNDYGQAEFRLTAIADNAFSGSRELKSVTLPSKVNKIGSYAFSGCTGLNILVVQSPSSLLRATTTDVTVPTVGEHAFDDICETAVLYVPENWKEAFKAAPEWSNFYTVKEQRTDGTVLAELTMTSTYGGTLTAGEITSDNGSKTLKVAEGNDVTVTVTTSEGYKLNSLTYDGIDVIDRLVDGKLTLSKISGEKNLTAEFCIDTAISGIGADGRNVYVKDGKIVINGVAEGEEIVIYNASGQLLHREVANGASVEIPMAAGQVYVVKIGSQSVKMTL